MAKPTSKSPPISAPPAAVRRVVVVSYHLFLWALALQLALQLRFEGDVSEPWATRQWYVLGLLVAMRIAAFYKLGLFHGLWRYAGMPELKSITWATTIPTALCFVVGMVVDPLRLPRTTYVGEWLAAIVLVGGSRFAIRLVREWARPGANGTSTLIVGAGDAGESLLRDIQRGDDGRWVVKGFLDDDVAKTGALVRGVRVLGTAAEETLELAIREHAVALVILAIPGAEGPRVRQIVQTCRRLGIRTQTVPSLADRMDGQLPLAALREVAIEDLLRRAPVKLDTKQVEGFLQGRVVLVTGGAGSIGSELARQVLRFQPEKLLLFDHDENGLFFIERELRASGSGVEIHALIGELTDARRVAQVFSRFRPAVVFHAAAHKHVPMMEANPVEAVKNNVLGTKIVADAADEHGARAFVMVSTDKAVNPTSVMGTTKRIAEMVIQARATTSETRFVAVRFGNVLGSAGSVVPLFREQIANGGPVQVTHPDMKRYFMTIPEAAQLVMQAGALGKGGEIFLLDMGEPVKIADLARDLIQLSGLRPDIDIHIEFTGVRPGEKLFEELLHDHEAFDQTPHPKIVVGRYPKADARDVARDLTTLSALVVGGDERAIRRALAHMVPEAKLSGLTGADETPAPASCEPVDVVRPSMTTVPS